MRVPLCVSASVLAFFAVALVSVPAAAQMPPQEEQQGQQETDQPDRPDGLAAPSNDAKPSTEPEAQAEKPQQPDGQPETARPAAQSGQDSAPPAAQQQTTNKPAEPPADPKSITLRIATAGGAYLQSQQRAYFDPFTRREGYQIKAAAFDGTYDTLARQAGDWDVVNIDGGVAARACSEQRLEPLDAGTLQTAPNGAAPAEDFLAGAIQACAVASVAWSAVVVYDKSAKKEPAKQADFFDIRKFPGKRLLPREPKFTLEFALLADGVAPGEIYNILATPEGQTRALAKLAAIKDSIVWFEKPSDMFAQIARKDIVMGLGFNGRAFMEIVNARRALGIIWDRQIYAFDFWAVPRGAKNAAAAKEFVRFATAPGQLADQTRWMPYGPARRSAVRLVGKHAEVDMEMKPYLPTYEPNLQNALAFDAGFWMANGAQIKERFDAWVEGREVSAGASDSPR